MMWGSWQASAARSGWRSTWMGWRGRAEGETAMATHQPLGTGTGAAQLPRVRVDFNDVWEQRDDGTAVIVLGTADAPQGHDHPLYEGMLVVCEEPGELHMTGVVRRWRIESGACWVAELDPRTRV